MGSFKSKLLGMSNPRSLIGFSASKADLNSNKEDIKILDGLTGRVIKLSPKLKE